MNEENEVYAESIPTGTLWAIEPNCFSQMIEMVKSDLESAGHDRRSIKRGKIQRRGRVAVIRMAGPLTKHPSLFQLLFGGDDFGTTVALTKAFDAAAADETVESILLRIDSPGGSVDGLAELVDAVKAAAEKKQVIAQVEGMMASAALHVASGATRIFAQRMDMIGSIGSRMMLIDISEQLEREGVKVITIDTGEFKSAGVPGVPVTENHIAHFQGIVDAFFSDFVAAVAEGRGMTNQAVLELADGRMFMAEEAVENGLIDGIQTLGETLTMMGVTDQGSGIGQATTDQLRRRTELAGK